MSIDWVATAAVIQAVATIVLVGITWRYVRLTQDLVGQQERALAAATAEAETQRRAVESELLDEARGLADELERRGATFGVDLTKRQRDDHWRNPRSVIERAGHQIRGNVGAAALATAQALLDWESTVDNVATGAVERGRDVKGEAVQAHRFAVSRLRSLITVLEARREFRDI